MIEELVLPQHRLKRKLYKFIKNKKNDTLFKKVYYTYIRDYFAVRYGVEIGVSSKIGEPVDFPHPRNIVIGEGVQIGNSCIIYHDVTIGQKNGLYPNIGDNVTIFAGSKIIGGISIGNNVVVGANSVVIKDVPNNCVVAGNPARVIGYNDEVDN